MAVKVSGTYLQNIAGSASNHKMKETHNSIKIILNAMQRTHPIIEYDIVYASLYLVVYRRGLHWSSMPRLGFQLYWC